MEQVDPKALELVQKIITDGGEQWQLLATELSAKAWIYVYAGIGVTILGSVAALLGYLGRNRQDQGTPAWITSCIFIIVGVFTSLIHLGDALAPMNGVLWAIARAAQ